MDRGWGELHRGRGEERPHPSVEVAVILSVRSCCVMRRRSAPNAFGAEAFSGGTFGADAFSGGTFGADAFANFGSDFGFADFTDAFPTQEPPPRRTAASGFATPSSRQFRASHTPSPQAGRRRSSPQPSRAPESRRARSTEQHATRGQAPLSGGLGGGAARPMSGRRAANAVPTAPTRGAGAGGPGGRTRGLGQEATRGRPDWEAQAQERRWMEPG